MINIFVYGTLRKGESNHSLLKNAKQMAEQCWTNGVLYDTGFGYPAMKQSQSSFVYGELFSVTERELLNLDELEGYTVGGKNNLYERVEQTVFTDKGELKAFVYVANRKGLLNKEIQNGDWKEYRVLSKPTESILYFAYGSCMDDKRFKEDGVEDYFQNMIGVGVLQNYSLRFTRKSFYDGRGRADIVEEGGRVEGKVYEIPVTALNEYLYGREGAPKAYRPTFVVIELNREKVLALTFVVVNKKSSEIAPPNWYATELLRGADGVLTTDYVSNLESHKNKLNKF